MIVKQRLQTGKKAISYIDIQNDSSSFPGPTPNTATVLTLSTDTAEFSIAVLKLYWSYSADPTGGKVTMTGGINTLELDIVKGGNSSINLGPYIGLPNQSIVITLAAGGVGITGKLVVDIENGVFRNR